MEVVTRKILVSIKHLTFWFFFRYILDFAPQRPQARQQRVQQPTTGTNTASNTPRTIAAIAGASHRRNYETKTKTRVYLCLHQLQGIRGLPR